MLRSATKGPLRVSKLWPTYSMRTNLSMISRLAVVKAAGQCQQSPIQNQPDHAYHQHGHQNVLHILVVPFIPSPDTQAGASGQNFCLHNANGRTSSWGKGG